jgi:hypothetical protein
MAQVLLAATRRHKEIALHFIMNLRPGAFMIYDLRFMIWSRRFDSENHKS